MNRGEIWLVSFDPAMGPEIRKKRPAIIVSAEETHPLPLKIIVPITSWQEHYSLNSWMVRIEADRENGLSKTSAVDTLQIRSAAYQRFIKHFGSISQEKMEEIEQALMKVLGIRSQ